MAQQPTARPRSYYSSSLYTGTVAAVAIAPETTQLQLRVLRVANEPYGPYDHALRLGTPPHISEALPRNRTPYRDFPLLLQDILIIADLCIYSI